MRWWLIVMLAGLGGAPAFAQDLISFRSPSGNIYCLIAPDGYAEARCDMRALQPSFRNRPADCDLEWGDSFAVLADSRRGELVCHGDTTVTPDAFVLDYGKSISLGGFTCSSEESGITCVNQAAHGFTLSRAKQSVF